MTLDERMKKDLSDLYCSHEIEAARSLNNSGLIQVSSKGLPQHFVGDRNAKTVFVMLNPGKDWEKADSQVKCDTCEFDKSSEETFLKSYIDAKTNYGEIDKGRRDSFDIKQAFFLKDWADSGIDFPANLGTDYKDAKEAVLMQKLQLELIPYCSARFNLNSKNLAVLKPYLETLLDEILRVNRKYVIFGSKVFADLFKMLEKENDLGCQCMLGEVRECSVVKNPCKAQTVSLTYKGKGIKAVIALSFARQDLTNARIQMGEYGKFCNELLK